MRDNKTTDVSVITSNIISKYVPRDLYKPNGGPTDHFRRSDVKEMLELAYKAGWNNAVRACVLQEEIK
ncbi:hypothetical protein [Acetobacter fabarum]|jgi:hypothetical protein|uniref:Uncharacterized protein n=1 Tax=Acetobacter fabarum TaxID=483199 RepID=A0A269XWI7_9PROT|nr:hypothetical protein [Acetobacter fabarum]PAK77642.1 hypothetical protein B8X00_09900 [Acetobacter fabarum]PEN23282.1 hypothetical protein CRM93_12270 [Acetobacter fabarum]